MKQPSPLPVRVAQAALTILLLCSSASAAAAQDVAARYGPAADRIISAALTDSSGYERLGELVDRFGPRFSVTPQLERAIDWILLEMSRDGLENVRGERVMVPRWVRGSESATLMSPRRAPLHMLGLGGSVGTPPRWTGTCLRSSPTVVFSLHRVSASPGATRQ